MSPAWKITKPKDEAEYFERMTKTVFKAGLTWTVIDKKWPNFRRSFTNFSPAKGRPVFEEERQGVDER